MESLRRRTLRVRDPQTLRWHLDREFRTSGDARYHRRLQTVLMVLRGMSARAAARSIGRSPRTVSAWVRRADIDGISALRGVPPPGRPSLLDPAARARLREELRALPSRWGWPAGRWSGRVLQSHLMTRFGVLLGVRQCQRVLAREWIQAQKDYVANEAPRGNPSADVGSGGLRGAEMKNTRPNDIE
ncbi:MAG: helix-turn-helix domain-containing protein [Elusimicrobiota bacterium]|jgi:transposase